MGAGALYSLYAALLLAGLIALTARSFRPIVARLRPHLADIVLVGAVALLYVLLSGDLLFHVSRLPYHDNAKYAFPFFHHMVDTLVQTGGFPYWLPYAGGGQPTFLYLNNTFLLHLPHVVAYILSPLYPGDINTLALWWWMIVLQNLAFALGVYLFLRLLLRERYSALFGFAVCLLSGITSGTLHQEQLMASIFYIPWVAIFFMRYIRDKSMLWGVLGALWLGFSLLSHYPHLVAYFWAIAGISYAVFHPGEVTTLVRERWRQLAVFGVIVCAMFAVDAVLLVGYLDRITSPLRHGAQQGVTFTYDMLTDSETLAVSSFHPHTLLHYLFPQTFYQMSTTDAMLLMPEPSGLSLGQWKLDNLTFYLGLIPLCFVVYAYAHVRGALIKALSLAVFLIFLLALGGESFGYYLLFKYLPMATLQRIPVHLANYINLLLIVIASLGFKAFVEAGHD